MKRIQIIGIGMILAMLIGCSNTIENMEENQTMTYLEYMASSDTSNQAFLLEDLLIPETYMMQYENEEGTICVEIDAEVNVPDVETLSIYRVSSGVFEDDIVQQLIDDYPDDTSETSQWGTPSYDIAIRQENFGSNYLVLDSEPITMIDDEVIYPLEEQIYGAFELTDIRIDNAKAMLEDMGVTDLVHVDSTPQYLFEFNDDEEYTLRCVYQLTFMRSYDNVPSVFTRNFTKTNNLYRVDSEIWGDEQVQVLIDESGILSVQWMEPYEAVEVYLEDVQLLSFSAIINLVQQMVMTQDAGRYLSSDGEYMEVSYHVDEIILGMKKITDIHGEDGLVVPVWDFQGSVTLADEGSLYSQTYENISILTINAVDGTVVNSVVEQ